MSDDKPTLTPVQENTWYILATLAGEQTGKKIDWDLHRQNRLFWNRWATQHLDKESIAELIENGTLQQDDIETKSIDDIEQAAKARGLSDLPAPTDTIDFSNTKWPVFAVFQNFYFPTWADFQSATFSDWVDFQSATFIDSADFRSATFSASADFQSATFSAWATYRTATFSDWADFQNATFSASADFLSATFSAWATFQSATFSDSADFKSATFSAFATFQSATFSDSANFKSATFSDWAGFQNATFSAFATFQSATFSDRADFKSATFSDWADFESATFSDRADFLSATFSDWADFTNTKFESKTVFDGVHFESQPPMFFGAKLHEGTTFHKTMFPDPPDYEYSALWHADAYERLKLEMDRLNRHEEELRFFAHELAARRYCSSKSKAAMIWLYGLVSDYGRSVGRPVGWLAGVWLLFGGLFGAITGLGSGVGWGIGQSFGMSASSLGAFFGMRREFFPNALYEDNLPWIVPVLSGVESILGAALVFLLLLALRNRFRIK